MAIDLKIFRFNKMTLMDLPSHNGYAGFIAKDNSGRKNMFYGSQAIPEDLHEFFRFSLNNGNDVYKTMAKEAYANKESIEIFGKHLLTYDEYSPLVEEVLLGQRPCAQILEMHG